MRPRWLIAHDFSPFGDAALLEAARLLKDKPAKIVLAHVVVVPVPAASGFWEGVSGPVASHMDLRNQALLASQSRLEAIRDEVLQSHFKDAHDELEIEVQVIEGDPVDALLALAHEHDVNRICVGSHSRKGLDRYLLGSVAEKVVRQAQVPVLVVKRPESSDS